MDILESIEENKLCITCIICVGISYPPTMLAMTTTRTDLISPLLPTSHNVKWVEHQLYNYIIDFLAYNRNWCEMRISSNSVNSSRQHKYSNGVDIVSNHIYFDSILLWLSLHSNDFWIYCVFSFNPSAILGILKPTLIIEIHIWQWSKWNYFDWAEVFVARTFDANIEWMGWTVPITKRSHKIAILSMLSEAKSHTSFWLSIVCDEWKLLGAHVFTELVQ